MSILKRPGGLLADCCAGAFELLPMERRTVKKELIDRILEVARQTCRDVEAAVSSVEDPNLRAVLAGALMQRILQEAAGDESRASPVAAPRSFGGNEGPHKRAGTQARILELRDDKFFADPRRLEQVLEELRIRGYHHNKSDLRMSLLRLARKKALRRIPLGEGRQRMYLYVNP
jgi:hypothetical protein